MINNKIGINNIIEFEVIKLSMGKKYEINEIEIITVISGEIYDGLKGVLKSGESSVYYGGFFEAKIDSLISIVKIKNKDIILNKIDIDKEFGSFARKNWTKIIEDIDLYKSNVLEYDFFSSKYKFNFWFCGKNIDCGFHNEHDFIEIHTCIAGDGYMQKSLDGTEKRLIETVGLLPGNTHRKFNIEGEFNKNGYPQYPFHRWLGGNMGNIWLAIEKY